MKWRMLNCLPVHVLDGHGIRCELHLPYQGHPKYTMIHEGRMQTFEAVDLDAAKRIVAERALASVIATYEDKTRALKSLLGESA